MARSSGTMQAIILARALAAGTIGTAVAADLPALPPPPPLETPAPIQFNGWYLRGDVGAGLNWMRNFTSSDASFVPGFTYNGSSLGTQAIVDAGVGYQFNHWFRADITGEYRTEATYRAGLAGANVYSGWSGFDTYNGGVSTALFMANGYFDLGTWHCITPFIGGGVGIAAHNFAGLTDSGGGVATDATPTNFAWAVMAGLALDVTPNLKIELGYRYLDMGNINSNPIQCLQPQGCWQERHSFGLASQDVRLGLRYAFGVAPVPMGPLVTKY